MISAKDPRYGWILIGMFAVNYSMVVIAIETIGLLLPQISEELSLSLSQQGWLASSVLFSNLILEIPATWLFSKYRPWRASAMAFFAAALFVAFNGWAPTIAILFIARIGLGMIYLSTQASRTLLLLHWIPVRQIGIANGVIFSVIEAVIGAGFIVMPLILAAVDDWRNALYIWAGACGVGAALWLALGRDKPANEREELARPGVRSPLGSLFRYKETWILGLGVSGASAGRMAFATFWPTYVGNEYGISITIAGLILGLAGIARAPAILGVTRSSFISARTPLLLVICGILECVTFMGMIFGGTLPILFLSGIINGMVMVFIPAMMTMLYRLPGIQEREAAVAVAVYFSWLWMGAALGPVVTGLLSEATGDLGFALLIMALGPLSLVVVGLILQGSGRGVELRTETQVELR